MKTTKSFKKCLPIILVACLTVVTSFGSVSKKSFINASLVKYFVKGDMMFKNLKNIGIKKANSMGLFVFNVLLLVVFIVSIAWGGFAKTGSGIPIPDTGLIIPFFIFILFSIAQLITIKCNKYTIALALEIIKFILFQFAMYMLCGYALNNKFIQANKVGSFYDNSSYTVMVIIFMCVGCLSFIYEMLFNILLSIRGGRNALR